MSLICLTGAPGCGKSTVVRELQARGWMVVSAGSIMRGKACELGIDITRMQRLAEQDSSIDRMIDRASRDLSVTAGEKVVLDARMGWAFAPFPNLTAVLTCDAEVAGQRVYAARRADEGYASAEEATEALVSCRALEADRYRRLYGVSYDEPVFDLSFNTVNTAPAAIADVLEERARVLEDNTRLGAIGPFRGEHIWLSNMYPCACTVEGMTYPCSESAYQALKTDDLELRRRIANMDGKTAKAFVHGLGVEADLRTRLAAMRAALEAKFFQNSELGRRLVDTRGHALVELNDWHDGVFGACTCADCVDKPALNLLGRELMRLRDCLAKGECVRGA